MSIVDFTDPTAWGTWFYLGTFLAQLLDAFFPPLPQELFVLAIPALASDGVINAPLAIGISVVGHVLGEAWLAWVVRRRTRWLQRHRWGAWLLRKAHQGERALGSVGAFSSLVGLRFVAGGRTAGYVAAGLSKVRWGIIWWSAVVGSILWVGFMLLIGGYFHSAWGLPAWASAILGMLTGSLVSIVPMFWAWGRRRRSRGDAHAATSALEPSQEGR